MALRASSLVVCGIFLLFSLAHAVELRGHKDARPEAAQGRRLLADRRLVPGQGQGQGQAGSAAAQEAVEGAEGTASAGAALAQAARRLLQTAGGACPDAAKVLSNTNWLRAQHRAPALAWDSTLAAASQAYAVQLATTNRCVLMHSPLSYYGETLYGMTAYPAPAVSCKRAVTSWYGEAKRYNFTTATPFDTNWGKDVGHFTQLVWAGTGRMGCGAASAPAPVPGMPGYTGGCVVVVCRFTQPGNIANNGAFATNVRAPLGTVASIITSLSTMSV